MEGEAKGFRQDLTPHWGRLGGSRPRSHGWEGWEGSRGFHPGGRGGQGSSKALAFQRSSVILGHPQTGGPSHPDSQARGLGSPPISPGPYLPGPPPPPPCWIRLRGRPAGLHRGQGRDVVPEPLPHPHPHPSLAPQPLPMESCPSSKLQRPQQSPHPVPPGKTKASSISLGGSGGPELPARP